VKNEKLKVKNGKSSVARRAYGIVEIGHPGPTFYPGGVMV